MSTVRAYFSLVKFSHTIFALPFALLGYVLAVFRYGHTLPARIFLLVLLCMVFARSAAMAFNRYLDREIDRKNVRTAAREMPAGVISASAALRFTWLNAFLFVISAWLINPLCFYLSPVALLVILGYSYTKRFTYLCHFVLGLGLALAPLGAYLAVGGGFDALPLILSCMVLCWVAGFDIIYALQDEQFDRKHRLHSVPAAFGVVKAIRLSRWLHLGSGIGVVAALAGLYEAYPQAGVWSGLGGALFLGLLIYQHFLVKPTDLRRIDMAFFTTNGMASLLFGGMVILDFFL
jgi:4-hydroxybenzoate polyprenyltransferase